MILTLSAPVRADAPEHFISEEQYFSRSYVKDLSSRMYPPQICAQSEGKIVVTDGVRDFMDRRSSGDATLVMISRIPITRSYVESDEASQDEGDEESEPADYTIEFGKTKMEKWRFKVEKVTPHFGTGWATYRVTGSAPRLRKFLGKAARYEVIWVGLRDTTERFVDKVDPWITAGERDRNESW